MHIVPRNANLNASRNRVVPVHLLVCVILQNNPCGIPDAAESGVTIRRVTVIINYWKYAMPRMQESLVFVP